MTYLFAPLEGVTTSIFRFVHQKRFPGADQYYTPFFSPTADHRFTARELREIAPEYNRGVNVIPQILTKNAEDFLWAAEHLGEMGYEEINLNIGCPSATVTAKGKGSGLLLHPDGLDKMLETIYSHARVRVSIKTRIGYHDPGEWETLVAIYNRYPLAGLIVHSRTRKEMYLGEPHREAFEYALKNARAPLCYNGNLFTPEDSRAFAQTFPHIPQMLGRGAAADPGLFRRLKGGAPVSREELYAFHTELYEAYRSELGPQNAMRRMKELWSFLIRLFEDSERLGRRIMRSTDVAAFESCISQTFSELNLSEKPRGF